MEQRSARAVADPRSGAGTHPIPVAVRFARSVRLTKGEAFDACQVLADADRQLVRARCFEEADALASLFELLEARLAPGR